LADGASEALVSAFEAARSRRTAAAPAQPEVVFLFGREGGELRLSARVVAPEPDRAEAGRDATESVVLRSIDGWSLFPPLAAILVAVLSGGLVLGLSTAILSGGFIAACDSHPLHLAVVEGVRRAAVDYTWMPVTGSFQLYILAFTAALIGMVRVTSLAGGNQGIAQLLASRAEGAKSTRMAAFLMGLGIFFDDYANTVVVGSTLRPIADRFRVSREKLAYIVDSTAAPVAGVAVISTWIGYEVSLFQDLMAHLKTGLSGYQLFLGALPARFYCLLTLVFVGASSWLRRDYGPMLRAERRAQSTGQVLRPGAVPMTRARHQEVVAAEGISPAWWAAVLPVLLVVIGVVAGMALDTLANPDVAEVRRAHSMVSAAYWTACFSEADNARVLFVSAIAGSLLAIGIAIGRREPTSGKRVIPLKRALSTWATGISGVWYALVILVLAWSIKEVCTDAGTSVYLTAALTPLLSPGILPLLIFALASLVAFSIGTSWTTMAILIPMVVPLAHAMGGLPLTVLAAAAVLDGAIFGDHCSPISDTTVMSSIASSCDHLDHVRTQIPYAFTTMGIAALLGYLGTALIYPSWIGLVLGVVAVVSVLLIFGRDPDALPGQPAARPESP